MSNTIRKKKTLHRRMNPYSIKRHPIKYHPDIYENAPGTVKRVTKQNKLLTRNANRGIKKAYRRLLKNEIKQILSRG